jgi:hypothetical protein
MHVKTHVKAGNYAVSYSVTNTVTTSTSLSGPGGISQTVTTSQTNSITYP